MKKELAALRLAVKTLTEKYGWVYADDAPGGPGKFTRKAIELLAPVKTLGRQILVRLDADTDIIRVFGIKRGLGRSPACAARPRPTGIRDEVNNLMEVPFTDPNFEDRISRFEEVVAADSERAYDFARYVLWGPYPAGEAAIAKNAYLSFMYARGVIQGPFPAGEAAIAKDAGYAFYYAYHVLKGPFPAGEAAIAKEANWAYHYAYHVLKGPFPAGEAAIAKEANWAYQYAKNVLKGPFPAGEAAIAKDKCHHG